WNEYRQTHHPAPQYASDAEIDRQVDEAYDSLMQESQTHFFSAGGSSSGSGQ
ncbi:hypothetical protein A2U01_0080193, partial [Trifolium medium]|nr:hypothetical protein [Trifolium medium]